MTSYFILIYEPEAVSLGQGRLGMNSLRQKCQGAFRRQSRNQPSHKHSWTKPLRGESVSQVFPAGLL